MIKIKNTTDVIPEDKLRFKVDLESRISQYDMLWTKPYGPPADWHQGAPIGNGDFGAVVYGYPDNLSFALSKTDIWDHSSLDKSVFPAGTFEDFRKIYRDRDEKKYKEWCYAHLQKHVNHATTAGMFRLHMNDDDGQIRPEMKVSLYKGKASLEFTPQRHDLLTIEKEVPRRSVDMLVSREYKVIAIRVKPSLPFISWELSREKHEPNPAAVPSFRNGIAYLEQTLVRGVSYTVAMTVAGANLSGFKSGRRMTGEIEAINDNDIIVYLTIVSEKDTKGTKALASKRLKKAVAAGFEEIEKKNSEWWNNYWKRSYVALGDTAVEKWWYTSLYHCGSILEPGCQSPGLQGVWVKESIPAWAGDYHSNVNLQAVYWGLYTSNRVDFIEPYVRLIHGFIENCRKDTKSYYGWKGIRLPHAGSDEGFEMSGGSHAFLGVSVGTSSWLTLLLWQIYEYTQDKNYLAQWFYPLMKEVVTFYEDFLIWDEKNQRWIAEPTVHYEGHLPNFNALGLNSLYEITLIHGAFQRAIAASEILGLDADLRTKWQDILSKLSKFPTDGKSWISTEGKDLRQFGGHHFCLTPVFPEEMVSLWHGPEEWRKIALQTLADPVSCEKTNTGGAWCGGQGLRELARLGKVKEVFERSKWSEHHNINGLTHGWGAFCMQVDHGPGMHSVLGDMLLLNTGGVVRVFPCFPAEVPCSFSSLRTAGGFVVSAEKRGADMDYVIVKSVSATELRIANPWKSEARVRDSVSNKEILKSLDDILIVPIKAGQIIVIDRADKPIESMEELRWEKSE